MKRRTEITIETDRLFVIRGRSATPTGWCKACRAQVEMVTTDRAAVMRSTSSRAIYRLIENERLHYTETPQGMMLICVKSLLV